jgi:hypothetical protein
VACDGIHSPSPDNTFPCEQESQSKKSLRCAQQAYTLLFADVTTPGTAGAKKAAESPGYFAQLLVRPLFASSRTRSALSFGANLYFTCTIAHAQRHLIKVTVAKWDEADAKGAGVDPVRSEELSSQLHVAMQHLKLQGVPAFAGADAATAARELAWFAAIAWNAGLVASAAPRHDWASAARLFAASGAFMDAAPANLDDTDDAGGGSSGSAAPGGTPSRQLAWLLAAGASLEVHAAAAAGEDAAALLAEAQHALARCAAAGEAAASAPRADGASLARTGVYFTLLSFTARARAGDDSGCLDLLRSAEAMPGLSPDTALKLARLASAPGGSGAAPSALVALRAYELCLRVMQRTPGVAHKELAHVLRKTLTLAEHAGATTTAATAAASATGADSREARLLRGYREAAALLAGVPPGAYPPEEAHWLVTSAWNRGALLAKLGRVDSAEVRASATCARASCVRRFANARIARAALVCRSRC